MTYIFLKSNLILMRVGSQKTIINNKLRNTKQIIVRDPVT